MSSWPTYLVDLQTLLILIKLPVLILIQGELKLTSLTLSVALSLISLIISYSNVISTSMLIWCNLTQTLQKSTSQWSTSLKKSRTGLRWASTRKTRAFYKTGSPIEICFSMSYINILVFWTLLVKWTICWTISIWSPVTRFPFTMWILCVMLIN